VTMSQCSFCQRAVGEGWSEGALREIEGLSTTSARRHSRASLKICDICIDLYADTARRELALR
jgi:hypothetical protein